MPDKSHYIKKNGFDVTRLPQTRRFFSSVLTLAIALFPHTHRDKRMYY